MGAWINAVATLSLNIIALTSLAWAEDQPPPVSYARIASELGLAPDLVTEMMAELGQQGIVAQRAITFLMLAKERTDQQILRGVVPKDEAQKAFRESLRHFATKSPNWERLMDEVGASVDKTRRRAEAVWREAQIADPPRAAAPPKDPPEPYAPVLSDHLRVSDPVLRQAWGEVDEFSEITIRPAIMLLLMARARTDRLLTLGAIGKGEEEESFLQNLRLFIDQRRRSGGTTKDGWGDMATLAGRRINDVVQESLRVLRQARALAPIQEEAQQ